MIRKEVVKTQYELINSKPVLLFRTLTSFFHLAESRHKIRCNIILRRMIQVSVTNASLI